MEIDPAAPPSCLDPAEIDYICQHAARTPPGCFVEIGVYKGGFAYYLAKLARAQKRALYLYDTFEGTPYQGAPDIVAKGSFADTSVEAVSVAIPGATCVKGVFPESAIETGPIAFVHLDVDQYDAYKTILPYLVPRMTSGGLIWLADYYVYPGAHQATNEFLQALSSRQVGLQIISHAALKIT
jgi:predicted O-methyltransferase YrrM